jgi:hypothetical protein
MVSKSEPQNKLTVSGTYEGEMVSPNEGAELLVLRVDIDSPDENLPALQILSADHFQISSLRKRKSTANWSSYKESWILDSPSVNFWEDEVEISGPIRFWRRDKRQNVSIKIRWDESKTLGQAEVVINNGFDETIYICTQKSIYFREMRLEVDVCQSVSSLTTELPAYDTLSHSVRPKDLRQEKLTIQKAYKNAGIRVTLRKSAEFIDDKAPGFHTWSDSELHDAMETHFSSFKGKWPRWYMWGMLAGSYDERAVAGVMFDASIRYGGAGEPPERQGFAVFRDHEWFDNLPTGSAETEREAAALRTFLYTWVHEAGHAFNFLHSWNKDRPDSLSWMNYEWRYDNRNGPNSFWQNFGFSFDREELLHLRHGDLPSIIMGADAWGSGAYIRALSPVITGDPPLELLLRSKGFFDFLEPVEIEVRVRNLLKEELNVNIDLSPEYGAITYFIQSPDGKVTEYLPLTCKLATPKMSRLKGSTVTGEDRFSETIFLSYGKNGFYFDKPGEYIISALYQGQGRSLIYSNLHKIRVGHPLTRDDELLAQNYFTREVGLSLYLGGSQSPHLEKGMNLLEEIVDRKRDDETATTIARIVAPSYSNPFYRIESNKLVVSFHADPRKTLKLTERAKGFLEKTTERSQNLAYGKLIKTRARALLNLGRESTAKSEMKIAIKTLNKRGVNESVLKAMREEIKDA